MLVLRLMLVGVLMLARVFASARYVACAGFSMWARAVCGVLEGGVKAL
jgi:hypothetical protein